MNLNEEILSSDVFIELYEKVNKMDSALSLPKLDIDFNEYIDWGLLFFLLSALEDFNDSIVNTSILKCCIVALKNENTPEVYKKSALVLLERLGNWPNINLALSRNHHLKSYIQDLPIKFKADHILNKNELTVFKENGGIILANHFQKEFWEKSKQAESLSISAPTTSGKSFIALQKIVDDIVSGRAKEVIFIVPSKSLIQEISEALFEIQSIRDVPIINYPWDDAISNNCKKIIVMTQERVFITLFGPHKINPDIIFIDEAHKFDSNGRGVLLENLTYLLRSKFTNSNIIFASPLTDNPEVLNQRFSNSLTQTVVKSNALNVSQNLFLIEKIKGKPSEILVSRIENGKVTELGTYKSDTKFNRSAINLLPEVISSISPDEGQNLIYANFPADAEKLSDKLYSLLPEEENIPSDILRDFMNLVDECVHPYYLLKKFITKGIAYHYGRMPQMLRNAVEDLYKNGYIKYLVCTSTLLEGVNLPCKNIWIANPKKGSSSNLEASDFWNLAGRAGRWGKEYEGNIFFISVDTYLKPPVKEYKKIVFNSDIKLSKIKSFADVEENDTAYDEIKSMFFTSYLWGIESDLNKSYPHLFNEIAQHADFIGHSKIPEETITKNSSIDPLKLLDLFNYLKIQPNPPRLLNPNNSLSYKSLFEILKLCRDYLNADFGVDQRIKYITYLIMDWAKGKSTPQIISSKIKYEEPCEQSKINSIIRKVLYDIEDIALYKAPKFLSAYQDIYQQIVTKENQIDEKIIDPYEIFELGATFETTKSLIKIGFSRQSAIHLSSFIQDSNMNSQQLLFLIHHNFFKDYQISNLSKIEMSKIKSRNLLLRNYSIDIF